MIESHQIFADKELKLKSPFGMVVAGPSSSGKSSFLLKLITEADELITPPPKFTIYAYGEYNNTVPLLQKHGVIVHAGVPSDDFLTLHRAKKERFLLILDDLMLSIDEKYLNDLFTKKSHHGNFACIMAVQNVFERKLRVARQNAQYLVLMRSPSAALAVRTIGSQLFPRQLDYFLDAYRKATARPYGYLLVDCHAASDPILRLRTGIFKDDADEKIIFIPKNAT
jgi:hypothetical protein